MPDLDRARILVGAAAATLAGLFGGLPLVVQALVLLQLIDVVSGVLAAAAGGRVSSDVGWRRLPRKALTWCIVAAVFVAQGYLPEIQVPAATVVTAFYAGMELVSIVENAGKGGVAVPGWLRGAFEKLATASSAAKPTVP